MANSEDPDQMSFSVASDLDIHCLLKFFGADTWENSVYYILNYIFKIFNIFTVFHYRHD